MSIKSKTYWSNPFIYHHLRGGELTGERVNLTLQLECKGLLALEIFFLNFLSLETTVSHLLPQKAILRI